MRGYCLCVWQSVCDSPWIPLGQTHYTTQRESKLSNSESSLSAWRFFLHLTVMSACFLFQWSMVCWVYACVVRWQYIHIKPVKFVNSSFSLPFSPLARLIQCFYNRAFRKQPPECVNPKTPACNSFLVSVSVNTHFKRLYSQSPLTCIDTVTMK